MKKISFLFAILSSFLSIAQGPPMWSNGGNNVNSGDYVGTNNNQPLIFKTNSVERSRILPTGEFQIGGGGLKINPGTYNASPIGLYMFEVGGSAYVDRSLFVKEYINSLKGLRGPKIDVDSILMDSTRGIYGKTKIFGDVQIQQNLTVNGDATFNGKITATNGVMFDANNGFKMYPGNSTTPDIFVFGRISTVAPVNLNPCLTAMQLPIYSYAGRIQAYDGVNNVALTMGSDGVQSAIEHSGDNGLLINYYCGKPIYLGTGTGSGPNDVGGMANASVFTGDKFYARKNVQIGDPSGIIDPNVSLNVLLNGTTSGLKLWSGANPNVKLIHDNYDQFIFMGDGRTSIGVNGVAGAVPYRTLTVNGDASFANYGGTDGSNAFEVLGGGKIPTRRGVSLDNNSNVTFFLNPTSTTGAFKFKNGAGPTYDLMELDMYGKLSLTSYSVDAFAIKDFGTNTVNFKVKSNGFVYAREVNVQIGTFPDYVFEKSHKLLTIPELDSYISENKHLPGFKKGEEYEKEGLNVGDLLVKQQEKIEELALYIIELEKRLSKIEIKK